MAIYQEPGWEVHVRKQGGQGSRGQDVGAANETATKCEEGGGVRPTKALVQEQQGGDTVQPISNRHQGRSAWGAVHKDGRCIAGKAGNVGSGYRGKLQRHGVGMRDVGGEAQYSGKTGSKKPAGEIHRESGREAHGCVRMKGNRGRG